MNLLIATANAHKVKEFREMLGESRFDWSDLTSEPSPPPVDETGGTFRANACIKASAYAKHYQRWALADDSGLEVDALNGSPGVYSSRWAELHLSQQARVGGVIQRTQQERDAANNALLLEQLKDVPEAKRGGRFVCVLALSDPQGRIVLTARDFVTGRILRAPRGSNGFGYDPLFFFDSLGKTTAELNPDEKHSISHRGKALRTMNDLMSRVGFPPPARP